jgi:hypothetical protein
MQEHVRLQMVWDNLSCLGTEVPARLGWSLGGFQLMFQSSLSDGVAFDPFSRARAEGAARTGRMGRTGTCADISACSAARLIA